jgi:acetyltransferase-like isoleucine patch superfamily enzyme
MSAREPARKRDLRQLLSLAAYDPAQFWERMYRTVGLLRAKVLLRGTSCGERVYVGGHIRLSSRGRVIIGDRAQFLPGMIPMRVVVHPGAELRVGADTGFNYGVSLEVRTRLTIGERCMLGTMVRITDSNESRSAPVTIGDDVWLAHGVVIEPGVSIGSGSVITAGSVVRQDVPAGSIALGNPAKSVPLPGRSRFLRAQAPEAARSCRELTTPGAVAGP